MIVYRAQHKVQDISITRMSGPTDRSNVHHSASLLSKKILPNYCPIKLAFDGIFNWKMSDCYIEPCHGTSDTYRYSMWNLAYNYYYYGHPL